MKHREVRRQMIKEGAVMAGVLAVFGAIVFSLGVLVDDYEADSHKLEGEVGTITAQATSLREKYFKVQQNNALYQEVLAKLASNGLAINRQVAADKFNLFKDRFHLGSLRISIAGVEETKDAKWKRKNDTMVSSDVQITFDATSDEDIYNLMKAMRDEMPGGCKVVKLSLTRDTQLTNGVLSSISQKGTYPLVKGDMRFTWMGLKTAAVAKPAPAAPAAASPAPKEN